MTSFASKLTSIVADAFKEAGLPPEFGVVRVSDRPDLAQFQCNGAMAAAKIAKKNPREVAEEVAGKLKNRAEFAKIEIAGPGFINLDLTDEFIAAHLESMARDERLSVPEFVHGETAVLDYGGPNIAKPMHVGHLRAGIIGDTLRRIMSYAGYKTLGDVHMGDWGTHLGILFNDYIRSGEEGLVLDVDLAEEEAVQELFEDLSERYPRASGAAKADPALMAEAQAATLKMQAKEAPYYPMWEKVRAVSIIGMEKNYADLNVHFDLWKGEADVHELIPPMVDELKRKDYAVESEGALVVPVKRNDDNKEVPPLILHKRDGAVMYGTTDLATIVERMKLYNPAKIIYVVDQRQHLHFEQVFRAARMSGIAPETTELTHAGFGTMNGPDGKPFKTRAGGVLKLGDLIEMGVNKAMQRLNEADLAKDMPSEEQADIARKIAVAAIKFADLQNQRLADYVFDLDRLVSFEGKTGPYLLYQAVRIKSLLRKAGERGFVPGEAFDLRAEDEPLALLLGELPDVFEGALNNYTPHLLCDYAYRISQQFSSFYNSCHILSEEDDTLRGSRLALCKLTLDQLELVLSLLGISVPERM